MLILLIKKKKKKKEHARKWVQWRQMIHCPGDQAAQEENCYEY